MYFANQRCDHENDIEQLKNGVNAIQMPVDDLIANWAYMVVAALAWNLKAWYGLLTPNKLLGHQIIRMEFKRFINAFSQNSMFHYQNRPANRLSLHRIQPLYEGFLQDFCSN